MLTPREVLTPVDAEMLRTIRDECRTYMTGNTDPISPEQQQAWFAGLDRAAWRIFLYADDRPENHGGTIAYGLLRLAGGRWWLTFGVREGHRGRGVGKEVAQHLLGLGIREVWADVRVDNAASLAALRYAGFADLPAEDQTDPAVVKQRYARKPTIVLTIPTLGNRIPSLIRQVDSVAAQGLIPGDQVFVVVDGPRVGNSDADCVCAVCEGLAIYGRQEWLSGVHHEDHNWGNPQRNHVLDNLAKADLIVWNDDDDVTMPGAWDAIRRAADEHPGKVLMFRFMTVGREVLWERPLDVRPSRIGGHCIVTPNVPGRVGRWGRRYEGDYDFITSTLALTGGAANAAWIDHVIATARPDPE